MWLFIGVALATGSPDAGHDIPIVVPVPTAAAEPISPVRAAAEADTLYLKGVAAWRDGKWARAARLCSEALRLSPEHSPARLLAGYSLLRLRKLDEGLTTLDGLARPAEGPPLTPEVQRRALHMQRRFTLPRTREQVSLTVSTVIAVERSGGFLTPLGGYAFAAQGPIVGPVATRVSFANPFGGSASLLDVRGPRFDLLAVTELRLGGGLWFMDLGAGPALWIAEGGYWADGTQPYVGLRAAVGIDVRMGRTLGLRLETGFSAFPQAAADLSWHADPVDFRLGLVTHLGAPRPFERRPFERRPLRTPRAPKNP